MRRFLCAIAILCFYITANSQAIITPSNASFCISGTLTLTGHTNTNIQWLLNGGPIPGATSLTHTATVSGIYTVEITGSGPLEVSSPSNITISTNPVAGFSFTPNNQCSNTPVSFTNTSTGSSLIYAWNFDDLNSASANTSTQIHPSHEFIGSPGNSTQSFNVTLTTNSGACSQSTSQVVTTKQLPGTTLGGPGAVTYDGKKYFKVCGNAPSASFNFTNQSSTVATNTAYTIKWGDASPDFSGTTFNTTSHTYSVGTYQLLFIVNGSNGCTDTATYYVFVGSNPAVGLGNPGNTAICTNNTLTFPISGTSANPPGTVYTVTFNDGTSQIVYQHPAPADVSHTFLLTSCGTNSPGYPNSFNASIQASNPCASSTATVVPIYVSQKSAPNFTINPNDTVCVNTVVSIVNTTGTNYNIDNGNCTTGQIIWTITPSTGYTVNSGVLGNDFGLTDPASWVTGSNNLSLTFNIPGLYSIKIKSGNTTCGLDSLIKTICVNPLPTGSFTLNTLTGCAPLNVTTISNTNNAFCGANRYQWNISYTSTTGCSPTISNVVYLGGTNSTSAQPEFQFINPGTYNISLWLIAPASSCSTLVTAQQVIVKAKPIVTLSPLPANPCANQFISPGAAATCYVNSLTTYAWLFPGGTPSSANVLIPGSITYAVGGTYTISLAVTNECGTTTATQTVTVNPTPDVITPSNLIKCAGESAGPFTLTSTTPGATFSWNVSPAIGLTGPGNNASIPVFTTSNNGSTAITGIITGTATLNGCSSSSSFNITVNPKPSAPVVTSPINYCQNTTALPLTATGSAGNTLLWYTAAIGGTGSSTAPTPATNATGTTIYYVSQLNPSTNCESIRSAITVTINQSPVIAGSSFINPAQCGASNGSFTLTGLNANTSYNVHYINAGGTPVSVAIVTDASGSLSVNNLPAGSYTNVYVELNNCPSPAIALFTLADPSSPATPSVTANGPLCSGATLTLGATTTSTGIASYQWSGPNSFSNATQNPSINNVTIAASGTYNVTVRINGCTSAAGTVNVIINATPAAPSISNNAPICEGQSLNLNANTVANATYSWSGPNGFTSASEDPVITNATTAAGGTYSLIITATTGNCASQQSTTIAQVKPTPVITASSTTQPTLCNSPTGTIILNGLTTGSSYTVNYIKNTIPVSTTITAVAGNVAIPSLTAGTYSNIQVILNGCPSNIAGPFTLTDPLPPAAPTAGSNSAICSGNTLNLSAINNASGIATYIWSGPNGFTSTDKDPVILNATVAATGTYNVTVTVDGCTSPAASVSVIVNPTPSTPVTGSNSPVCSGQTISLTASTTATGTITYAWTGPGTFPNANQNPVILNAQTINAGTYSVIATAVTGNCPSAPSNISVVVNPTPSITSSTAIQPGQCNTATGSITLNGLGNNISYTVHYSYLNSPVSVIIPSNGTGSLTIPNLAAGSYTNIFVESLSCMSNLTTDFTLVDPNPPAAPIATSNTPVCSGTTLKLFATATAGSPVYTWTGPNGFTSAQQNPVISSATTSMSGTYTVTVTVTGCTSLAGSVTVLVDSTPVIPAIISNGPVCSDSTLNLSATTISAGGMNWQWTGPNGFTSALQSPVINGVTIAAAGNYNVIATATQGNCASATASFAVVINPTPVISNVTFINPSQCNTPTGSISITGLTAGLTYTVNYLQDGNPQTTSIPANSADIVVINNLSAGTYSNLYVVLTGCRSLPHGPYVLTNPSPPLPPSATSNTPVCSGQTLNLFVSTTQPGTTTFSWTGPDGFSSASPSPTINNTSAASAGNYVVTVTINNCVSPATTIPVVINPLPPAPTVITPVSYCINTLAVPLTATPAPGNPLNWYSLPVGGTAVTTAPVPSTAVTGNTPYYVSQTNSFGCEGPRDTIRVIINPDAIAQFTQTDTIKCPPFNINSSVINLQPFPANNSIYEWYVNNIFIGTGTSFPGYTILTENNSVTVKLKAISLFGCKADSVSQIFNTYNLPHPSFDLVDTVGCGPLSVQVINTTPNPGLFTYAWNFGNGQLSTQAGPGNIIFLPNPTGNDTTYHVSLQIFSICDTITVIKDVRVKSKPKALFTPDRTTGCSPMTVFFQNTSLGLNSTYYWDFGDGATTITNTLAGVQHTYNTGIQDTFIVRMIAVNECGSDTARYSIIVAPNNILLNFTINGPEHYGCAPHTVMFINNTSGATTFAWNFGDGNTLNTVDNIDTVYHTFLTAGNFTVTLTAANSCTDTTATDFINVYAKPIPAFIADNYTQCQGNTVTFTNQSSGATSYLWDFGDGNTSALLNPTHVYTLPGLYNVKLTVFRTNPPGNVCSDEIIHPVQVVAGLPGNFIMSAVSGTCAPLIVNFTNQTLPSVTATWDFGDGTLGSGDNVSHTYTLPGIYNVTLTVIVPGTCTYTSTQTVTLTGPSGSMQYTGGYNCSPAPVRLEATATNYDNVEWNFGDGNTLLTTQLVVFHQYANPGVYVPYVIIKNNAGCNFPVTGIDTIKVDRIDAGFTATQSNACDSTAVQFNDTSHVYFGKAFIKWDFGDGNTGTGINVNHTYLISGTYPVQMIVIGNSGCTDTISIPITIQVNSLPEASIAAVPTACTGVPVIFNSVVQSTDPLGIQQWNISNGASGTGPSLNYTFTLPGTYTIRFITGTINGCYDTANHIITIRQSPVVTATAGMNICLGNTAQLNASGAVQYQWSPLQGLSCTNCSNPVASPIITTPYIVTGTNALGCTDTATITITVIQPLNMIVSPNDTICIAQSANLNASGAASYIWTPAAGLSSTTISNPVASPVITTTYRVVGYDGFSCFTDTAFIVVAVGEYPTIDLGADQLLSAGTILPLTTTVTNGPVMTWQWIPSQELSCSNCALPNAFIKKDISYIVNIKNIYGCPASDTINIKVFCKDTQVFIPNAFTPDGDGINDILMVRGKGIVSVKSFRIFNRWGEIVFEKSNFPPNTPSYGWNGKIKGVWGPPDVFVYTAEVLCENGTPFTYKGNVSIIK